MVTESLEVIATGDRRTVTFGYSDDEAFAVGLTCGGTIHLFLEPLDWGPVHDALGSDLAGRIPRGSGHGGGRAPTLAPRCWSARRGPRRWAHWALPASTGPCSETPRGELVAGRSGLRRYSQQGEYSEQGEIRGEEVAVFVESFRRRRPRMLIFGAVDFTAALARVAKVLGYRVTVCDARSVFATAKRFPMADEVVVSWPDRLLGDIGGALGPRAAVCVLTHDAKFDVPAITSALATDVGYIGVMGSRRTHDDRTRRLIDAGVTGRPAGPTALAHRARHRRRHSRGDRGLDCLGDHLAADWPQGRGAIHHHRAPFTTDPPNSGPTGVVRHENAWNDAKCRSAAPHAIGDRWGRCSGTYVT